MPAPHFAGTPLKEETMKIEMEKFYLCEVNAKGEMKSTARNHNKYRVTQMKTSGKWLLECKTPDSDIWCEVWSGYSHAGICMEFAKRLKGYAH